MDNLCWACQGSQNQVSIVKGKLKFETCLTCFGNGVKFFPHFSAMMIKMNGRVERSKLIKSKK